MKKLYLFLIYYLVALAIFNGIIFIFEGNFDLVKSFLLPLLVVIIVFVFGETSKKKERK